MTTNLKFRLFALASFLVFQVYGQSDLVELLLPIQHIKNRQFMVEHTHDIYGKTRVIAATIPFEYLNVLHFQRIGDDRRTVRTYTNSFVNTFGQLSLRGIAVDDFGKTYCLMHGGGPGHQQLICFDDQGNIAFQTSFTANGIKPKWFHQVIAHEDGVYIFFSLNYSFQVCKFSGDGTMLWSKEYTGTGTDENASGSVACKGLSNDLIVTGTNKHRKFVMHINPEGEIVWSRSFSTVGTVRPFNIFQDSLGTIHLHGIRGSNEDYKPYYMKYDAAGNFISADYYTINTDIYGLDVKKNPNGSGYFMFANTAFGGIIVFLDEHMQPYLTKTYSQNFNLFGTWFTRLKTDLNALVINSDYKGSIIFKLENLETENICPNLLNFVPILKPEQYQMDSANVVQNSLSFSQLSSTINTPVNWNEQETYNVKVSEFCFNKHVLEVDAFNSSEFQIFPNPAQDQFSMRMDSHNSKAKICIVDATGVIVKQLECNNESIIIDISNLQTGIYTVFVETEKQRFSKRITLLR